MRRSLVAGPPWQDSAGAAQPVHVGGADAPYGDPARGLLVALASLLLGATACSSGPDDGTGGARQPAGGAAASTARESLARMFAGDQPDDAGLDQGRCFADRLLTAVSPAQLQQHGVLDADHRPAAGHGSLPAGLATAWAEAQLGCVSFYDASTRAQQAATRGRLDEGVYRACLRAGIDRGGAVAGTAAALQGEWHDEALAALGRVQAVCAAEAAPRR